jgi:hypothetical protein
LCIASRCGDGDQGWAQNSLRDQIALLQNTYHRVGVLFSGDNADRLVMVRVKFSARLGIDGDDLVSLKRTFELSERGLSPFFDLLWRGFLDL